MDDHVISTVAQLRALYRTPSQRVQEKKTATIDGLTREIIEGSPFFLLATSSADGACDVSPRGGPPGQLVVLDDHHVAFPDLSGNNLIDSLTNLVQNPQAGLLVLTPGRDETLRIDGRATVSVDPELLSLWDELVRRPKVAVVINVENTFIHCAKAFKRAGIWDPQSWSNYGQLPDYVELFLSHMGIEGDIAQYRQDLDQSYADDLASEKPQAATEDSPS